MTAMTGWPSCVLSAEFAARDHADPGHRWNLGTTFGCMQLATLFEEGQLLVFFLGTWQSYLAQNERLLRRF